MTWFTRNPEAPPSSREVRRALESALRLDIRGRILDHITWERPRDSYRDTARIQELWVRQVSGIFTPTIAEYIRTERVPRRALRGIVQTVSKAIPSMIRDELTKRHDADASFVSRTLLDTGCI